MIIRFDNSTNKPDCSSFHKDFGAALAEDDVLCDIRMKRLHLNLIQLNLGYCCCCY